MHTSPFADILGRIECFGLNASLNALALNELDFHIKCIYNRSSIISSYDLLLTTNIKIPGRTIRKVMEWGWRGRGGGSGGEEFSRRRIFFFFRYRIPCIIFFRPSGLIGVHDFFFHLIFPCANIFFVLRY